MREIFTLSGGHIFSIYDGAVKAGWRIVDTRHEQTATWAAEGMAKLTRRPGEAYDYSNLGMGLLGHALSLKGGSSYEQLVIELIDRAANLKMTNRYHVASQCPMVRLDAHRPLVPGDVVDVEIPGVSRVTNPVQESR